MSRPMKKQESSHTHRLHKNKTSQITQQQWHVKMKHMNQQTHHAYKTHNFCTRVTAPVAPLACQSDPEPWYMVIRFNLKTTIEQTNSQTNKQTHKQTNNKTKTRQTNKLASKHTNKNTSLNRHELPSKGWHWPSLCTFWPMKLSGLRTLCHARRKLQWCWLCRPSSRICKSTHAWDYNILKNTPCANW
jgi:hypothetical protein